MRINDHDFDDERVVAFLAQRESDKVRSPVEYLDDVVELINTRFDDDGIALPWPKTHDKVRLRPGEVSVWAGINGHMKSMVLGQVAMWAAREQTVGVMSFEMPVSATLRRMAGQAAGTEHPAKQFVEQFVHWADQRMWFYTRLDSVPPARVLGCALHMGKTLGCGLIVIDSLMMCGVSDDMERERRFMAQLTALAKSMKTHIAIVHHVRKPHSGDESKIPTRFDVKGNGAIVDLASSLFICWNDKRKNEIANVLRRGDQVSPADLQFYEDDPDQFLVVAKQRNAAFEGNIALWIHPSMQFTSGPKRRPMMFTLDDNQMEIGQ